MSRHRDRHRFKISSTFSMPYVKLQEHVIGPFYTTVGTMTPYSTADPEPPVEELIEWAEETLLRRRLELLERRAQLRAALGRVDPVPDPPREDHPHAA